MFGYRKHKCSSMRLRCYSPEQKKIIFFLYILSLLTFVIIINNIFFRGEIINLNSSKKNTKSTKQFVILSRVKIVYVHMYIYFAEIPFLF